MTTKEEGHADADPSERDVLRIKCRNCGKTSEEFGVMRTFFCGEEVAVDIDEKPFCPLCLSHKVMEILK